MVQRELKYIQEGKTKKKIKDRINKTAEIIYFKLFSLWVFLLFLFQVNIRKKNVREKET